MPQILKYAWEEYVAPLFRRPSYPQVAALCYRGKGEEKEVLLVTSRGTGRWILPKGWPMEGKAAPDAAAQEAWEEAGVKEAKLGHMPVGAFSYEKALDNGVITRCEATVFPLKVKKLADEFPESHERTRKWVAPEKAAKMVDEPGLKRLLRNF